MDTMTTATALSTDSMCDDVALHPRKLTSREALRQFDLLINKIAYRFWRANAHLGIDLDDLVQVGMMAVVDANDRYDPNMGVLLMTYVYTYVEGRIQRECAKGCGVVRTPINGDRKRKIQGGRAAGIVSTAKLVGDDEGSATVGDLLADDSLSPERIEARATIERLLALIDEQDRQQDYSECQSRMRARQRAILSDRYLADVPATFEELAIRFGCTAQSMKNAEKDLIERIRRMMGLKVRMTRVDLRG